MNSNAVAVRKFNVNEAFLRYAFIKEMTKKSKMHGQFGIPESEKYVTIRFVIFSSCLNK